jgi:Cytidine and deoxycytidylate deaminase zinc-binding region
LIDWWYDLRSMNQKTINRTIEIAKALCPLNLQHRCSHIAFLVKCGKIVYIGTNSCKSHPKTLEFAYRNHQMVGLHAELAVCMKSGKEDLQNYELIVLRIDRRGNLNNSRPCCGCQSVIKQFNIHNVYYSNSHGLIVKN